MSIDLGMLGEAGPIKVKVERRFQALKVDIWIVKVGGSVGHERLLILRDWDWVDEGYAYASELGDPSFSLDESAFKALMDAGSNILPPGAATDRHLNDAIKVRDRLLTLIEREDAPPA